MANTIRPIKLSTIFMFKPKALYIIDPDLLGSGGHNIPMDSSLTLECMRREIPVKLFGRVGGNLIIHDQKVNEVFRFGLFLESTIQHSEFPVFNNYFLVNQIFLQDLNLIDIENFSPEDLIYFPNLTQNQIDAVGEWIVGFPVYKRPNIAITLRYMGWAMQYNSTRGYSVAIEFLYSNVLQKLRERHDRTFLFSDTQVLAENFTRLNGAPVTCLPNPQLGIISKTRPRMEFENNKVSLLFIGGWGDVHGACFVPDLVRQILATFPEVVFTVQVNADHESKQNDLAIMLGLAQTLGPRLTVLPGKLSDEMYTQTLDEADIVVLPYQPSNYWFASSGIFTEAAGRGKVLVVTAGTTLATGVTDYELGAVIMPEFTSLACHQSVAIAIIHFEELNKKAKLSQSRYATDNSPKGFFDSMFSYINQALI